MEWGNMKCCWCICLLSCIHSWQKVQQSECHICQDQSCTSQPLARMRHACFYNNCEPTQYTWQNIREQKNECLSNTNLFGLFSWILIYFTGKLEMVWNKGSNRWCAHFCFFLVRQGRLFNSNCAKLGFLSLLCFYTFSFCGSIWAYLALSGPVWSYRFPIWPYPDICPYFFITYLLSHTPQRSNRASGY